MRGPVRAALPRPMREELNADRRDKARVDAPRIRPSAFPRSPVREHVWAFAQPGDWPSRQDVGDGQEMAQFDRCLEVWAGGRPHADDPAPSLPAEGTAASRCRPAKQPEGRLTTGPLAVRRRPPTPVGQPCRGRGAARGPTRAAPPMFPVERVPADGSVAGCGGEDRVERRQVEQRLVDVEDRKPRRGDHAGRSRLAKMSSPPTVPATPMRPSTSTLAGETDPVTSARVGS